MKQKLLFFIAIVLTSVSGFSQATATQPPSLTQCNNEVFDLTVQTPIILGAQNPQDYSVTYAVNGNLVTNPSFFVPNGQSSFVTATVTNLLNDDTAVTNFWVTWFGVWVDFMPNVTVCGSYTLPQLQSGNYYTGPGGTGTQLAPGTVLSETQTIYIFDWMETCSAESSFVVTVINGPEVPEFTDIVSCEPVVLPAIDGIMYSFSPNPIPVPGPATVSFSTDVEVVSLTCGLFDQFHVMIGAPAFGGFPVPYIVCNPDGNPFGVFDLNEFSQGFAANFPGTNFSFHLSLADAENNVSAVANASSFVNTVPSAQTIYVRAFYNDQECASIYELQLVVLTCTENSISGNVRLDYDNNGCSPSDPAGAGVMMSCTNGSIVSYDWTDANGNYQFFSVQEGDNVISVANLPAGFEMSGTPQTVTVEGNDIDIENVDFCLSLTDPIADVQIILTPLGVARPGFLSYYQVTITNLGNTTASGNAIVEFNDIMLNFESASPLQSGMTANTVSFTYGPLLPTQSQSYAISFAVATPPTANAGDFLEFVAETGLAGDVNLENNQYELSQIIVNSYDPNDIMVAEGAYISEAQADGYLNYIVRFQNTGTAEAVNIRIENKLDENLDWSTFTPIASSHSYSAQRTADDVTFRFDGIMLPATSQDELGSHGFIAYRIKPVSDFSEGEVIYATANIYFDFNAPIVTNTVSTQIQSLGVGENENALFAMYPNPATDLVTIRTVDVSELSVAIYDSTGKQVYSKNLSVTNSEASADVSSLSSGLYLVRMESAGKTGVKRLVVK